VNRVKAFEMSYASSMNFSWIENRRVAGCRGPRTTSDLAFLRSQGIGALVRLAYEEETGMTKRKVEAEKIDDFYEPVRDFTAPSQEQIDRVLRFMRDALDHGRPVAVSCGAGIGRTGTILGCYLVSLGHTAEQAIQRLRSSRPGSVEVLEQRETIIEFERRFRKPIQ
jgi:atypical dual specificity phosphatase